MTEEAIATRALTKRHGHRTAVDALTMTVPSAQVTGFVGPNGAGKTTTIRMLLGLIRPTSGSARVLGEELTGDRGFLRRVGALVDGPAFYPGLSGRANLLALARLARVEHRIDQVLEAVDMTDRSGDPVSTYSLGMRQRLALAAALLPDPALVILDEPANGLDPAGIRDIRRLLRRLADQGTTVFVSSHQLTELEEISDQVVLLRRGGLLYQGGLADLLNRHPARLTVRPEDPGHLGALLRLTEEQGWDAAAEHGALTVAAPENAAGPLNRLAHRQGITLTELSHRPPTLEEIFFALTQEGT